MRIVCLFVLVLVTVSAAAAPMRQPARLGLCAACHGADGRARIPGAPNLAGQSEQYLLNALHAYRSGARDVPVMRAAAGPLSGTEMQQLAHWYASLSACAAATKP